MNVEVAPARNAGLRSPIKEELRNNLAERYGLLAGRAVGYTIVHEVGHGMGLVANQLGGIADSSGKHDPMLNYTAIMNDTHNCVDIPEIVNTKMREPYTWREINICKNPPHPIITICTT